MAKRRSNPIVFDGNTAALSNLRSLRQDYNTPEETLGPIRQFWSGRGGIGLDPCSNRWSTVRARTEWHYPKQNGYVLPWRGNGNVFVNPPYGDDLPRWTAKAAREGASGTEVMLFVPARMDTIWWRQNMLRARRHCYPPRQDWLVEGKKANPATGAMVLAWWGDEEHEDDFDSVFCHFGWILPPASVVPMVGSLRGR